MNNDLLEAVRFNFAGNEAFTYDSVVLNEGAHFVASGQEFAISYAGGTDNNDVVLTAVPEPGAVTSLLGGLGMLLGLRRRRQS